MTPPTTLDAPLLAYTEAALARPLPPPLARARDDATAAASELLAIPEATLARPWAWIGGSEEEIRYGAYRAIEALELAEIEARILTAAADEVETRAARIVAPSTAARWDLLGLLAPLSADLLDADPGNDEWTIRRVLGHVISAQRSYGWCTAWWQATPHDADDPALPTSVPELIYEALPEDADEARGTRRDIETRLNAILDLSAECLAAMPDDRLALGARWSGFAVTVGFRLGRWSSHLREHAIQVEKTLAMLGRTPTEPERLTRLLLAAYGRAEATVFGRGPSEPVTAAAERIARGATEALDTLRAARAAAP
jgi:hypothetical protein